MSSCQRDTEVFWSNPTKHIEAAFAAVQKQLEIWADNGAEWTKASGATGTIVIHEGDRLVVAYVGDCKAVLATKTDVDGEMKATELTEEHTVRLPGERARVLEHGATIRTRPGCTMERVCSANSDYPGLNMTRALGDVEFAKLGVSAVPSVVERQIKNTTVGIPPTDHTPKSVRPPCKPGCSPTIWATMTPQKMARAADGFVIIATDGLWEFIGGQESVNFVLDCMSNGFSVQQATDDLVMDGWSRWVDCEKDIVDDITVLIALL
eukprot:Platyproteum_vivax@DN7428_c0_g1_i4.p2